MPRRWHDIRSSQRDDNALPGAGCLHCDGYGAADHVSSISCARFQRSRRRYEPSGACPDRASGRSNSRHRDRRASRFDGRTTGFGSHQPARAAPRAPSRPRCPVRFPDAHCAANRRQRPLHASAIPPPWSLTRLDGPQANSQHIANGPGRTRSITKTRRHDGTTRC